MQFEDFYKYFETAIDDTATKVYNEGIITSEPNFKYFFEIGAYTKELNNPDGDPDEILVKVSNKEKIQDPNSAIGTYVQTIGLEFVLYEEQVYDLNNILQSFFSNYRLKTDKIGDSLCQLNITKLGDYRGLNAGASERLVTTLDVLITVYNNAALANRYTITILTGDTETEIKPDALVIQRDSTLVSDLVKTTDIKFFTNSSTFTLGISGLLVLNNVALLEILNDCTNNSKFNSFYEINIKDNITNEPLNGFPKLMYSKSSKFDFINANIIKYSVQFYEGISV